jgi:hypothetical protein
MLLHVSWHLAIWVLPIGVTQEHHMKPPGLDLYLGGHQPLSSHLSMLGLTCAR